MIFQRKICESCLQKKTPKGLCHFQSYGTRNQGQGHLLGRTDMMFWKVLKGICHFNGYHTRAQGQCHLLFLRSDTRYLNVILNKSQKALCHIESYYTRSQGQGHLLSTDAWMLFWKGRKSLRYLPLSKLKALFEAETYIRHQSLNLWSQPYLV